MVRRLLWLAPLALLASVAFVLLTRERLPSSVGGSPFGESPLVGKPVPAFDLPGLDAENPGLSDADLRQGTVTLVNFFASWCLPCAAEAPQLEALAASGVVIHAVALRDRPADVAAFLARHGDPFRRIGLDPDGKLQAAFGSQGLPETYVVDGKGVVRYRHLGDLRPEHVIELRRRLQAAR